MNDTLLYTLPQWFIFAAIFVTVYGWIEQKKSFRIIGTFIFVLLGIFSLFVIFGDYLAAGNI
jgi:predicted membrane channel-forming protein YqfA (hemolysin III family)